MTNEIMTSSLLDGLAAKLNDKMESVYNDAGYNDASDDQFTNMCDKIYELGMAISDDAQLCVDDIEMTIHWMLNMRTKKVWRIQIPSAMDSTIYIAGEEHECAKRMMDILGE